MSSRRTIAALLGALAIVVPRVLDEWQHVEVARDLAVLGFSRPHVFSVWLLVGFTVFALLLARLVVVHGARGLGLIGLLVLAHAIGQAATHARGVDELAPHVDAIARIEAPNGSALVGATMMVRRGDLAPLAWPFAPLVLVAFAAWLVRREPRPLVSMRPLVALGLSIASVGLSLLAVSLWSQGVLPADGATSDELIVVGHGLALAFCMHVSRDAVVCGVAIVGVFIAFAIGVGFAHEWKPTRALCWTAGSESYDRATRERALKRARARLARPTAWLPSLVFPVRADCDRAARARPLSLAVFQPLCVVVLAIAIYAMSRTTSLRALLRDYVALAVAAWIGEETCIRLYHFYGYSTAWAVRLDEVPLLVPLIWPLVVLSARQIGSALGITPAWMPAWVLLQVTVDASLVEIIAVRAGFWTWTQPGYLDVPVIGILGWSFFAVGAVWALERGSALLVLAAAPVVTHAALLTTWWLLFRWELRTTVAASAVYGLLALSLFASVTILRRRERVPLSVMMPRMIAASLFLVVLGLQPSEGAMPFVLHTIAVAAPYISLTRFGADRLPACRSS